MHYGKCSCTQILHSASPSRGFRLASKRTRAHQSLQTSATSSGHEGGIANLRQHPSIHSPEAVRCRACYGGDPVALSAAKVVVQVIPEWPLHHQLARGELPGPSAPTLQAPSAAASVVRCPPDSPQHAGKHLPVQAPVRDGAKVKSLARGSTRSFAPLAASQV